MAINAFDPVRYVSEFDPTRTIQTAEHRDPRQVMLQIAKKNGYTNRVKLLKENKVVTVDGPTPTQKGWKITYQLIPLEITDE